MSGVGLPIGSFSGAGRGGRKRSGSSSSILTAVLDPEINEEEEEEQQHTRRAPQSPPRIIKPRRQEPEEAVEEPRHVPSLSHRQQVANLLRTATDAKHNPDWIQNLSSAAKQKSRDALNDWAATRNSLPPMFNVLPPAGSAGSAGTASGSRKQSLSAPLSQSRGSLSERKEVASAPASVQKNFVPVASDPEGSDSDEEEEPIVQTTKRKQPSEHSVRPQTPRSAPLLTAASGMFDVPWASDAQSQLEVSTSSSEEDEEEDAEEIKKREKIYRLALAALASKIPKKQHSSSSSSSSSSSQTSGHLSKSAKKKLKKQLALKQAAAATASASAASAATAPPAIAVALEKFNTIDFSQVAQGLRDVQSYFRTAPVVQQTVPPPAFVATPTIVAQASVGTTTTTVEKQYNPSGMLLMHSPDWKTATFGYKLSTFTDNGQVWGTTQKLYNVANALDMSALPKVHHPILLSPQVYSTLTMELNYMPVPASSNGPVGSVRIVMQLLPSVHNGSQGNMLRPVISHCDHAAENPKQISPVRSEVRTRDLFFAVEVKSNTGDKLRVNMNDLPTCYPEFTLMYNRSNTIVQRQQGGTGGSNMDFTTFNLFWTANVRLDLHQF